MSDAKHIVFWMHNIRFRIITKQRGKTQVRGLKDSFQKMNESFVISSNKRNEQLAVSYCLWKAGHITVTPVHSKNTAASEGADAGQSSGDHDTEDREDTRKPADPAPTDEPCELEGADDSLEFKTPATNVTQMHF